MNEDFTRVSGHVAVLRRRGWIIAVLALLAARPRRRDAGPSPAPLPTALSPWSSCRTAADAPTTRVVETQVQVVSSDPVVAAVIEGPRVSTQTPADVLEGLSVEVVSGTTTLSISATLATRPPRPPTSRTPSPPAMPTFYAVPRAQQRDEETVAALEEQLGRRHVPSDRPAPGPPRR